MRQELLFAVVVSCLLSCVSFSAFAEQEKWHYIIGSSVNLRDEPRAGSKIVVKLAIGSPVRLGRTQGEWAQVHDGLQGWLGWVRRDLLGDQPPSFAEMWENYKKTTKGDVAERKKWLERALALEPTSIQTREELARVYEDIGDKRQSEQIRREAEFIRNPDAFSDKNERHVVFFYRQGVIEPLAFVDEGELTGIYKDQNELDQFIQQYLRAGRRYRLISGDAEIGTATITHSVIPGSISLEGCHGPVIAAVKPAVLKGINVSGLTIATNRSVGPRARTKERMLTTAEKATMAKLSVSFLLEALWPPRHAFSNREVEEKKNASKVKPTVSGVAKDLDGDGKEELISTVHFHSTPPAENSSGHGEFSAVVLLVLKKDNAGQLTPVYHWARGGRGDAILHGLNILGFVDINGDGTSDIVTEEHGYEHHAITVRVSSATHPVSAEANPKRNCDPKAGLVDASCLSDASEERKMMYQDSAVGSWSGC